MSFGIYLVGYIMLIVGFALGSHFLSVEPRWISVGVLCLVEIAIVHGVNATQQRDFPF
jgi:predicted signal transduction protein with EAL and GGDEF domain